ncbi:MAG: ATP-dependent DNA helicase [uncultured Sulfurovum sp.]|uniref:ATP-dependent DNA helicase n=1 Tax=uncultured Sulfurovum sp. TaxID=269237 RepID=A0A6S6STT3_9BACT|nr:MAG: ATP-dependent DNA helicase [uncultured Sulfurovum sp.]
MNIQKLINNGENKKVEFKEQLPKNESIVKTIISFSNTSGGKLIIGVNDNREVVGVEEDNIFELQDKISSLIFDSCYPNILPEIYTLNLEGKLLLVIEVFRGNLLPYYLKKDGKNHGTYIRVGASNRKAGFENIIELERQRRNISYDEELNYEVELSSLDLSPIYDVFQKVGKNLDEQKLKNLKLIKEEHAKEYPSNALLILLGYHDHCMVKCAKFKGTTMELFLDKKEYGGSIFEILENTQNFILNHINLRAEIKGLYRTDTYEIPIVALGEALINALIHRDYINQGRDIKVGVYDDIVNIVSPGSYPNSINQEDIDSGRSDARNRVIANVFKELGLIEQWGSGIARIKKSCLDTGLKEPKIVEQNDFVDVEFYRPIEEKTVEKVSESIGNDRLRPIMTDYDQIILEYIEKNKKITRKEAKVILDIGETKIKELFNELMKKKLIERVGAGRSTFYVKVQ